MADELGARQIERLLLDSPDGRRFTQDSPVLPDVWKACWLDALADRRRRLDLLITPFGDTSASALALELQDRLDPGWRERSASEEAPELDLPAVAYNASTVAARLRFEELVRVVLPLTDWWRKNVWVGRVLERGDLAAVLAIPEIEGALVELVVDPRRAGTTSNEYLTADLLWTVRIVGALALAHGDEPEDRAALRVLFEAVEAPDEGEPGTVAASRAEARRAAARRLVAATRKLVEGIEPPEEHPLVFSVNRNRPAEVSVCDSALAVKADAARRLFEIHSADIAWAVVDSGIDATHPAFAKRKPGGRLETTGEASFPYRSRVVKTYDFSLVRYLLSPDSRLIEGRTRQLAALLEERSDDPDVWRWKAERKTLEELAAALGSGRRAREAQELRRSLESGRQVDWDLVRQVLEIPHEAGAYRPPLNNHGTHVAGILGADWRKGDRLDDQGHALDAGDSAAQGKDVGTPTERDLLGVCPDIRLYDLRVLGADGRGDEFAVIAALQFVRHMNLHKDYIVVHGANLSLSIRHEVSNYACGRTPVCEEAERLVASGVMVVAAAGNRGYLKYLTDEGPSEGYHSISITDPGNAEGVLTVGATHRSSPHTYGVSYFSSRGPTGDGRLKPDLVAPGEKILSAAPEGRSCRLDGTSMAAPHASGVAALLMARHRELAGQPRRVKEILLATATDLGRER
ncbi:MAG TPA: S8 family peptidase, partial [Thermoanaerobaculia bacterium]|nr:S8 family peptidase [Thermoanaerobaculia bacterium]